MYDIKTVSISQGQGTTILIFSDGMQKLCIDCMPGGDILIRTPSGRMCEKITPIDYDNILMEISNNIKIKKIAVEA